MQRERALGGVASRLPGVWLQNSQGVWLSDSQGTPYCHYLDLSFSPTKGVRPLQLYETTLKQAGFKVDWEQPVTPQHALPSWTCVITTAAKVDRSIWVWCCDVALPTKHLHDFQLLPYHRVTASLVHSFTSLNNGLNSRAVSSPFSTTTFRVASSFYL